MIKVYQTIINNDDLLRTGMCSSNKEKLKKYTPLEIYIDNIIKDKKITENQVVGICIDSIDASLSVRSLTIFYKERATRIRGL